MKRLPSRKLLILILLLSFYGLLFGQEKNASEDTLLSSPQVLPDSLDTTKIAVKSPLKVKKKRKRKRKAEKITGWVSFENIYDNNILDYSKADVRLLENNSSSTRFYIKKTDDIITSFENRIKFNLVILNKKPTELGLLFDLNFYAVNSVRNYQIYEIGLKQKLFSKNYLFFEQSFIPKYYLRHLWDQETSTYKMAKFKRRWTNLEWRIENLSKFDFGIGYIYQFTDYNYDFNERDTKAHTFSVKVDYKISKRTDSRITYMYTNRNASGKNEPDSIIDISNRSNFIGLEFNFQLRKLLNIPLLFSPSFNYEWQKYTTDKVLDKYHYQRKDNYFQLVGSFSYRLNKKLIWYLVYSFEDNQTNIVSISDPTSYSTHKFRSKIKYLF